MNSAIHFDSYSEGRTNFKQLLDAAEEGRVATVSRDAAKTAVVDARRMRHFLASVTPSRAQVVAEAGWWSVFIPGLPVAADAELFDDALADMVTALREYAEDWQDHLRDAPNHKENWGLVQLIVLSSDEQLTAWLVSDTR
ncbi:prevent-host-death protein [Umezawaea sp. Da 62-37]|uniref:prevent-host-death protein n=1 Tax=Umezawaea sp. Da 62-37 TaxID=3075927 RepID=UPI0028F6DB6D|nr:prevent-host-death protein [Umezawaea sp. Da 62-37]WNV85081.1 prevent-host-death protein [Umezawaea sp. Da 62-37]